MLNILVQPYAAVEKALQLHSLPYFVPGGGWGEQKRGGGASHWKLSPRRAVRPAIALARAVTPPSPIWLPLRGGAPRQGSGSTRAGQRAGSQAGRARLAADTAGWGCSPTCRRLHRASGVDSGRLEALLGCEGWVWARLVRRGEGGVLLRLASAAAIAP